VCGRDSLVFRRPGWLTVRRPAHASLPVQSRPARPRECCWQRSHRRWQHVCRLRIGTPLGFHGFPVRHARRLRNGDWCSLVGLLALSPQGVPSHRLTQRFAVRTHTCDPCRSSRRRVERHRWVRPIAAHSQHPRASPHPPRPPPCSAQNLRAAADNTTVGCANWHVVARGWAAHTVWDQTGVLPRPRPRPWWRRPATRPVTAAGRVAR
jgi:hypothetical protein